MKFIRRTPETTPETVKTRPVSEDIVALTQAIVGVRETVAPRGVTKFMLKSKSPINPNTVHFVGQSTYAQLIDKESGKRTLVEIVPSNPNDAGSAVSVVVSPPDAGSRKVAFNAVTDVCPPRGSKDEVLLRTAVNDIAALADAFRTGEGSVEVRAFTGIEAQAARILLGASELQRPM